MSPALVKAGVDAAITAGKIGASAFQNKTEKKNDLKMGDSDVETTDFNRRDLEKDKEQDYSQPALGAKEDTPQAQEIADVNENDAPENEEKELEKPELPNEQTPFDKTPEDNSSSSEGAVDKIDKVANIVSEGVNSGHSADTSAYTSGGINGASAVGSSGESAYEPLQLPTELPAMTEGMFSKMMSPDSPETKSMLEQAEEAYSDDEDIDKDELPFTDNEKAAEDVEDVVEAEIPEETKEEILEKADEDDGKVDEGEILDKAAEVAAEQNSGDEKEKEEEEKSLKDKLKDAWSKGQPLAEALFFLFNPKSTAEGESLSMGNSDVDVASMENADISTEGGPDTFTSSSGGAPGTGSASGYSGGRITSDTSSGSVDSRVGSSAGRGEIENSIAGGSSSGSSSSGAGSIRAAFDKIVSGGIDSGTSGGDSSFEDSGMSSGNVGSVEVKGNDEPLKIGQTQTAVPQVSGKVKSNPVTDAIHETVAKDWEKWPERDGIHYKDKGSIGIFTENGQDVFVKMGTRRIQPLENIDPNKLACVEEIL